MIVTFRIRRGTAAAWASANPVLALGEPGLETDTRKVKYGDGATAWNSLTYSASGSVAWTDVTGKPANLTAIAALSTAADKLSYWTGSGTAALTDLSSFGRSLIDDTTAATARATLGVETGITLTDSALPRLSMVRSGVGTWHLGNQTAGGTTNTFQITFNSTSVFELTTSSAATFRGTLSIAGHGTTASGANAFIDSTTGLLSRSTSSVAYKRDVEPLDPALADAVLELEPIWYRSAIETDRQDWSWLGFSAEQLAAIEPRLVHWGYLPEDYDQRFKRARILRKGAQLRPLGVAYDRMTVPLLSIVQRMAARIDGLEEEITALKRG